jgi:predicted nucleotidyltransferase
MNNEELALKYLLKKDYVIGAFIFGSYARKQREHNDIDVVVLTNKDWYQRESKRIDGTLFEFFYRPISSIKETLSSEKEINQLRWFNEAKIIYDPAGKTNEIVEFSKKLLKKKLVVDKARWRYWVGDQLQDITKENNPHQKAFLMQKIFKDLTQLYFLCKKEMPPKDNYVIKKIQKEDPQFFELVKNFIDANTENQEKELLIIVKYFEKKIGKPRLTWTSKKKQYKRE